VPALLFLFSNVKTPCPMTESHYIKIAGPHEKDVFTYNREKVKQFEGCPKTARCFHSSGIFDFAFLIAFAMRIENMTAIRVTMIA